SGHVSRLPPSRRSFRRGRRGAAGMSAVPRQDISIDPMLVGAIIGLAVLGTIMVGSASISLADNASGEPFYYLVRHLGALLIGCIGLGVAAMVPMETWYRLHWLFLLAAFALLTVVLVPSLNHTVNGSARWVALGPIPLQPSEPARLCLLLYLSSYCVRHHRDLSSTFSAFAKPLAIVALACVLLLAEPDFGAAVVLTSTALALLFVAGARLRDVTLAVGSASVV